jgi:hypothetical protein
VSKKTVLDYSGEPKIVEHRKQIEIRVESDAVYLVDSDTLYFKTIGKLKVIFPGIEMLHREATQDEVDAFIENDFISLSTITSTSIGVQNSIFSHTVSFSKWVSILTLPSSVW